MNPSVTTHSIPKEWNCRAMLNFISSNSFPPQTCAATSTCFADCKREDTSLVAKSASLVAQPAMLQPCHTLYIRITNWTSICGALRNSQGTTMSICLTPPRYGRSTSTAFLRRISIMQRSPCENFRFPLSRSYMTALGICTSSFFHSRCHESLMSRSKYLGSSP